MKIASFEAIALRVAEDDPLANMPEEAGRTRPAVALRLRTDSGIEGIGVTLYGKMTRTLHTAVEELAALTVGEDPMRILGAFSLQLRRLAQAARLHRQGQPLPAALAQAGMPPFAVKGCEQQLRHLGRRRAERLYDWLLEVDLGLKGSSELKPRMLIEELQLLRPIYRPTAAYGHFGRNGDGFTWERTNKADALRSAAKLRKAS